MLHNATANGASQLSVSGYGHGKSLPTGTAAQTFQHKKQDDRLTCFQRFVDPIPGFGD
jgi:hypothetical protein